MSTMEEDTELRDMLIESLHKNGVLASIKVAGGLELGLKIKINGIVGVRVRVET